MASSSKPSILRRFFRYLRRSWPRLVLLALKVLVIFTVPWLTSRVQKKWKLWIIFCLAGAVGFLYCKTSDYYTGYGMMVGFFLGTAFEEKYVNFENTSSLPKSLLRLAGSIAVYLVLNTLLKMPFPAELLESATTPAFLIRTLRYTVVLFVMIGVYPAIFKKLIFSHNPDHPEI